LINNLKARGYDTALFEKQLLDLKAKYLDEDVKNKIDADAKKLKNEQAKAEKRKEIIYALYELGQTLV
jgi:hypothetical protein